MNPSVESVIATAITRAPTGPIAACITSLADVRGGQAGGSERVQMSNIREQIDDDDRSDSDKQPARNAALGARVSPVMNLAP